MRKLRHREIKKQSHTAKGQTCEMNANQNLESAYRLY
jgi:hypothetical protein